MTTATLSEVEIEFDFFTRMLLRTSFAGVCSRSRRWKPAARFATRLGGIRILAIRCSWSVRE